MGVRQPKQRHPRVVGREHEPLVQPVAVLEGGRVSPIVSIDVFRMRSRGSLSSSRRASQSCEKDQRLYTKCSRVGHVVVSWDSRTGAWYGRTRSFR